MATGQIYIGLNTWRHGPWDPDEILFELVGAGWAIYTGHLPVGSQDLNNWKYNGEEFAAILDIFKVKYARKEVNGIKLAWSENSAAGNFLFWPEDSLKSIVIEITKNPQLVNLADNYQIIDVQWYMNRIFPILDDNFGVGYFEFLSIEDK